MGKFCHLDVDCDSSSGPYTLAAAIAGKESHVMGHVDGDLFKAACFDLFLLEIGCQLPTVPSARLSDSLNKQIHCDKSMRYFVDSVLDAIHNFQRQCPSSSIEGVCLDGPDSSRHQAIMKLIQNLSSLRRSDHNVYMKLIKSLHHDLSDGGAVHRSRMEVIFV